MPIDNSGKEPTLAPTEVVTDTWAVRLVPGADPDSVAVEHGAQNLGALGTLKDHFLFYRPVASVPKSGPDPLARDVRVLWLKRQIARPQVPRPQNQ
jgi:hypothetical protein